MTASEPETKPNAESSTFDRLSVLVPTFNRPKKLLQTLEGYRRQTLDAANFQVVIIDDGSDIDVRELVDTTEFPFEIKLFRQRHRGSAKAKNKGIVKADYEVLLFTGDDIIPDPGLLRQHLLTHNEHSSQETAVLGLVDWAKHLEVNPVMHYVTEVGGQQFAFGDLNCGDETDFWRFYTSNLSLKRSYLEESKLLFEEKFRGCGFEDIEYGYRLSRDHNLKILFNRQAIGFHDHPTNLMEFYKREFRVGEMQLLFSRLHPEIMQVELKDRSLSRIYDSLPEQLRALEHQLGRLEGRSSDSTDNEKELQKVFQLDFIAYVLEFARDQGLKAAIKESPY
ncbi:glycosyltransferase [bacterium]|nr:glycosyltransferase [bacterium]